jgi:hypothetical protein
MTLRDWFAGLALSGLLSDAQTVVAECNSCMAHWAYQIADAMLAESTSRDHPQGAPDRPTDLLLLDALCKQVDER